MSYGLMNLKFEWLFDIYSHSKVRRDACRSLGHPYEFVTLKALSRKYGYSYGYVRKVACIEKWREQRKEIISEIRQKTREYALRS